MTSLLAMERLRTINTLLSLEFCTHARSQKHSPPYKAPWFDEDVLFPMEQPEIAIDLVKEFVEENQK